MLTLNNARSMSAHLTDLAIARTIHKVPRGPLDSALQKARLRVERFGISPTAREVVKSNLTYLSPGKLRNIEWALAEVDRNGVEGALVETGVALGGSGIVIAKHLGPNRTFHGYDVFEMIPPPGDTDPPEVHERYALIASGGSKGIGGDVYYGYRDDLYEQVSASFSAFGVPVDSKKVSLHKGLFEDALNPTWPIAFAHVDCDWYEPVRLSLERIFPKMSVGAFLISDDYFDYGGAAKAVDEFRDMHRDDLIVVSGRGSEHMILQRQ